MIYAEQQAELRGEERGKREGKQEGEREGKRSAAIAIAQQLFDVLDLETIAQKTGLTPGELRSLRPIE
jgi:predicted transposase YdaD